MYYFSFAVQQGTLVFYILVKGSQEEEIFLKQERKPFAKVSIFDKFYREVY